MRRLTTFECAGDTLGASLDAAGGRTGVLIATGGSQTRVGSHRMFAELGKALAEHSFPAFRFDRRGVGDSSGDDPGFRGNSDDIREAAAAFRREMPQLQTIVGFGLCDGATSLALFGREAGIDATILVNPWFVEAASDTPPPAAIMAHYLKRLTTLTGWRDLVGGRIDYWKLLSGIAKIARRSPNNLAEEAAAALARGGRTALVLATGDGTAIAAEDAWRGPLFVAAQRHCAGTIYVETDSHTFARTGDKDALVTAVLQALKKLETSRSGRAD